LNFNNIREDAVISIFDMTEKLLINSEITNNQINICNLDNGIYIIKINYINEIITTKFVKQ